MFERGMWKCQEIQMQWGHVLHCAHVTSTVLRLCVCFCALLIYLFTHLFILIRLCSRKVTLKQSWDLPSKQRVCLNTAEREREEDEEEEEDTVKCNSRYQSNLWDSVGQATILCLRLWTHIFFSNIPSRSHWKEVTPTKAGALAYLYKDTEVWNRAKDSANPRILSPDWFKITTIIV